MSAFNIATATASTIDGRAFHYNDGVTVPFHTRQLSDGRWAFRTGTEYGSPISEAAISAEAARQLATMILDTVAIPEVDAEPDDA